MSVVKFKKQETERPKKLKVEKYSPEVKALIDRVTKTYCTLSSNYGHYDFKTGKLIKDKVVYNNNLYAHGEIYLYELKATNDTFTSFEIVRHDLLVECLKNKIGEEPVLNEEGEVKYTKDIFGDDFIRISLGSNSGKYVRRINLETGEDYHYSYITKRKLKTDNKFATWGKIEYFIEDKVLESDFYKHSAFDKVMAYVRGEVENYRNGNCLTVFCSYIKYRHKYPEVDNVIQKGLNLAFDMICYNRNLYDYFFKGNSFKQNFILPKDCLNYLSEKFSHNENIFASIIGSLNEMQYEGKDITVDILKQIQGLLPTYTYHMNGFYSTLKTIVVQHKIPVRQCISYLERVREYQACEPNEAISQWNDYLGAIKSLNIENFDKYPSSLKREHDVYCREAGNFRDAHRLELFTRTMENFTDVEYKNKDYTIVIPKEAQDLITEGSVLNHCVGTYVNRVIERQCTIFFVRDVNAPEKPLYTLEVHRDGSKGQLHGFSNQNAPKEAHKFANDFIRECLTAKELSNRIGKLEILTENKAV